MKKSLISTYLRKIAHQLKGLKGIILIFYVSFAISSWLFLSWQGDFSLLFGIAIVLIIAVVTYICPSAFRITEKVTIDLNETVWQKKEKRLWVLLSFVSAFLALFFWYLAYYPGSFSADAIVQYSQAVNGNYNDAHPVLQTLFTYTLPLKITGRTDSIIMFQIFEYSCVLSYMSYTLSRYVSKKYAIFSLLYILLNPVTGNILMNPWEDVTFAMSVVLLMVFGFQIYITDGKWLEQKGKICFFIIVLTAATLFKHNAALFTIPYLIGVLMYISNKELYLKLIMYFVILLMIIRDPVYYTLNVTEPEQRQVEMLGLPMTMLGNVAKESPESFDQTTGEFIFSVASNEDWKNWYFCGSFNSIKWQENTNLNAIEEAGAAEILSMAIKMLFRAPVASLKGFFTLTDIVYALDGYSDWGITQGIAENVYGIEAHEIVGKNELVTYSDILLNSILKYIFQYIGVINFVILISILGKCKFRDRNDRRKCLLCLPIMIYNFGTMFLLSGNDFRFFYLNFPIFPILLSILYGKKKEEVTRES